MLTKFVSICVVAATCSILAGPGHIDRALNSVKGGNQSYASAPHSAVRNIIIPNGIACYPADGGTIVEGSGSWVCLDSEDGFTLTTPGSLTILADGTEDQFLLNSGAKYMHFGNSIYLDPYGYDWNIDESQSVLTHSKLNVIQMQNSTIRNIDYGRCSVPEGVVGEITHFACKSANPCLVTVTYTIGAGGGKDCYEGVCNATSGSTMAAGPSTTFLFGFDPADCP
jgi:hypothetical protein